MMISFDLDDTLICLDEDVPKDDINIPRILRCFYDDPLRLGTRELMKALMSQGWAIAIYTSSYRTEQYIKQLFKFYGIPISKVINQQIHDREVVGFRTIALPSKLPPKFGIDLHVDDQDYLIADGARYGFDVIVVKPDDLDWTKKILVKADQIQKRKFADGKTAG